MIALSLSCYLTWNSKPNSRFIIYVDFDLEPNSSHLLAWSLEITNMIRVFETDTKQEHLHFQGAQIKNADRNGTI